MNFSEKRDFQRMAMNCTMLFRLAGNSESLQGELVNLSARGILFVVKDAIAPGTEVEIELVPVNNITPPMLASTIVARCEKKDDNEFNIAAEIVQIL